MEHIHSKIDLLSSLLPLAFRTASFRGAELIATGTAGSTLFLARLRLAEMMLGNPLFLVSASTSGGDGGNRGADSDTGSLVCAGLLGVGNESVVSVIEQATQESSDDGVG